MNISDYASMLHPKNWTMLPGKYELPLSMKTFIYAIFETAIAKVERKIQIANGLKR